MAACVFRVGCRARRYLRPGQLSPSHPCPLGPTAHSDLPLPTTFPTHVLLTRLVQPLQALPHRHILATSGDKPGQWGAELQPSLGSWAAWETPPPQPPSLTSSVLTAFQGYSCCRPGILPDFCQLFRRGSCFTPSWNDGICVQYQENANFYKSLRHKDKVLQ